MKYFTILLMFLLGNGVLLYAQKESHTLLMDGKPLQNSVSKTTADTIHIKAVSLKKAGSFTIVFENSKKDIFKRNTWLQNEAITNPATYSYALPGPNGNITITAATMRTMLKACKYVEIWTSLQPKNKMMMVRQTREQIYTIMID